MAFLHWEKFEEESKFFNCTRLSNSFEETNTDNKVAYIIGSGESINNITDNQWSIINNEFSIGLNLFCCHEFTPNMYMAEYSPIIEFNQLIHERMLNRSSKHNLKVLLSASYVSKYQIEFEMNLTRTPTFYSVVPTKTRSKIILRKVCDYFYDIKQNKFPLISNHVSNLDCAINMCVLMGYKVIKLVGIDPNNENYFYNINHNYIYRSATQITNVIRHQNSIPGYNRKLHATACGRNAEKKLLQHY